MCHFLYLSALRESSECVKKVGLHFPLSWKITIRHLVILVIATLPFFNARRRKDEKRHNKCSFTFSNNFIKHHSYKLGRLFKTPYPMVLSYLFKLTSHTALCTPVNMASISVLWTYPIFPRLCAFTMLVYSMLSLPVRISLILQVQRRHRHLHKIFPDAHCCLGSFPLLNAYLGLFILLLALIYSPGLYLFS